MFISTIAGYADARVEISDFFSDFTSSDVTINVTHDFSGKAVFELIYAGNVVESHEVSIAAKAGSSISKVILWQKKPQQDYYTANVSIYEGRKLLVGSSYQVSYGTVSLPGFHVVDFSPTNSGVQLLIRPFNPGAADIKIEMLDNNDIIYSKTKEDISLTTNTEIRFLWPFLLEDNKKYLVRAKIFTHRLYAAPLTNTYVSSFTAKDDVDILPDDVEVDEYGASVTVLGKSQVPFDGSIGISTKNRATNETYSYSVQMEEILVTGKEDTAGIVWKGLSSGVYDVEILATNKKNVTVDKYSTVLRIPEVQAAPAPVSVKKSPGFEAFLFMLMIMLFAAAKRI